MAIVNFNEIFAPMVKLITIRCILAIKVAIDWEIHQMDVKTTIFNGVLKVEIYIY